MWCVGVGAWLSGSVCVAWTVCCRKKLGRAKETFVETMKIPDASKTKGAKPKGANPGDEYKGVMLTQDARELESPMASSGGIQGKTLTGEQLSDYERLGDHATKTTPPEIPPASEGFDRRSSRKKLSFAKRGTVTIVPKDQDHGWPTHKDRLVENPERRIHPLMTIQEMGGWLIDPRTPWKRTNGTGEAVASFYRVPPRYPPPENDQAGRPNNPEPLKSNIPTHATQPLQHDNGPGEVERVQPSPAHKPSKKRDKGRKRREASKDSKDSKDPTEDGRAVRAEPREGDGIDDPGPVMIRIDQLSSSSSRSPPLVSAFNTYHSSHAP